MTLEFKTLGRVRKVLEAIDQEYVGNDEVQVALTAQQEQLVAAGTAPYQEIVRAGRSFWTNTTSAVAAVVALPTTACLLALYNNDVDGGRSLVIDWVAASGAAKTAAAGQAHLLANVGQVRETAPTDAALTIKKANGLASGANDTKVRTIVSGTALPAATGVAANWFPLSAATGFPGAAATPGHALYADVGGRFIIPPGRYFAVTVLADVVGSTFFTYVGWHELQLTLG
jgi:hypothetical protein